MTYLGYCHKSSSSHQTNSPHVVPHFVTFHPQKAAASRTRRTVDESKTSCLLHLHADHLYYKRFKSVEAVVAQVIRLNLFPPSTMCLSFRPQRTQCTHGASEHNRISSADGRAILALFTNLCLNLVSCIQDTCCCNQRSIDVLFSAKLLSQSNKLNCGSSIKLIKLFPYNKN